VNLEKLNQWLSLGANFGVLAGIAFLILEINLNTRQAELDTAALQTSNYQDLIAGVNNINSYILQDEGFADLLIKAERTSSQLTQSELRRYNSFAIVTYRHGDMAYYQYQQGTIDESRLNGLLSIVVTMLESGPQAETVWNLFKNTGNLDPSYVEHVENLRNEGRFRDINQELYR
jgi:hypothetical protein